MTRLAIILREGSLTGQQVRLGRILDFFGVPWKSAEVSSLAEVGMSAAEHVVFGSARTVAPALKHTERANHAQIAAFYAYLDDNLAASEHGLQSICGDEGFSLQKAPAGELSICVASQPADLTGAMSGLEVRWRLRQEDAVVVSGKAERDSKFATLISAGGAPVFLRFQRNGAPVFFCASSHVLDIDQAVCTGFFDVKEHFCSVVPLVTFLRHAFPNAAWGPQELGACLIIDDPLLRRRYGCCDFGKLRDLMQRYAFTTNIAFIPWNWRRTSHAAGDFFSRQPQHFSVSIHGCDHIASEFGTTSLELLHSRAKLAQARMRNHEARTGIHHDPIMVFPQGVFSSACPEALKRSGYIAAVNTETVPVDCDGRRTRIRDIWDVAITAYGGFPIFTRRYAFHGLENFAFDLLLGKPCLIVSHHDFFKDGAAQVVELVEKLQSLNCCLRWRPLGEVVRRACRRRAGAEGVEELEMYGNELLVDNPSDEVLKVRVSKRENQPQVVAEVFCDDRPAAWASGANRLEFGGTIPPHSEGRLRVAYREEPESGKLNRSLRFELSVAARRILSEFRDNYLSKSRSLTATATSLKAALKRAG